LHEKAAPIIQGFWFWNLTADVFDLGRSNMTIFDEFLEVGEGPVEDGHLIDLEAGILILREL